MGVEITCDDCGKTTDSFVCAKCAEQSDDFAPEVEIGHEDMRDGLRHLLEGNLTMARILLCRALDDDAVAVGVVEEVLRPTQGKIAA